MDDELVLALCAGLQELLGGYSVAFEVSRQGLRVIKIIGGSKRWFILIQDGGILRLMVKGRVSVVFDLSYPSSIDNLVTTITGVGVVV